MKKIESKGEMEMITTFRKIGNSHYVLVPLRIVESKKLKSKTEFDVHENVWDDVFRKPHKK